LPAIQCGGIQTLQEIVQAIIWIVLALVFQPSKVLQLVFS